MSKMRHLDICTCPLSGTNLIEASAGTGKTYTIAALFLRLIVEQGLAVEEVLVVTFTRAATAELRQRLYLTLQQARACFSGQQPAQEEYHGYLRDLPGLSQDEKVARVSRALRDFDEAGISTIHSFCQRMLLEHGFASASRADIKVTAEQGRFVMTAVQDFWRQRLTRAPVVVMEQLLASGIAGLAKLFSYRERNPELLIRGGATPPGATELNLAGDELALAIEELRQAWPETVAGTLALLQLEKKWLDGRSYQKRYVEPAARRLAHWLARQGGQVDEQVAKDLAWFSLEKLGQKSKKGAPVPDHPLFALVSRLLDCAAHLTLLRERYLQALQEEMFVFVAQRLAAEKQRLGLFAFNDFLVAMADQLSRTGPRGELARAVRKRYRAALIDEFQDTDPLQYAIFSTLFAAPPDESSDESPGGDGPSKKNNPSLFLIGDPKQAIYSFRGADVYSYLQAARGVERCYTLAGNYRSDAALVAGVNAIFSLSANPFVERAIGFEEVAARLGAAGLMIKGEAAGGLRIWTPTSEQMDDRGEISGGDLLSLTGAAIATEINRLLALAGRGQASLVDKEGQQRPLRPADFAVLVRSKAQMAEVAQVLARAAIPVVQSSATSIFSSEEELFMERLLAALLDPSSPRSLKAVLAHPLFGLNAADLEGEAAGWQQWRGRWGYYLALFVGRGGFLSLVRNLLKDSGGMARLLTIRGGERCLTNLLHLAEIIHERQDGGSSPALLLSWLRRQRSAGHLRQDEVEQRLESDANAVHIVTIHKSKGLEYPIVFAPFVWGRSAPKDPLCHIDERMTLFLDPEEFAAHHDQALRESLAENIRLYYVALTRARHRCYTLWTKFGKRSAAHSAAPAYLFHQGAAALEEAEPLAALKEQYDRCADGAAVTRHLTDLLAGTAGVDIAPLPAGPGSAAVEPASELPVATDKKILTALPPPPLGDSAWQIASFSSLSRHRATGASGPRPLLPATGSGPPGVEGDHFPRGAKAGTCLHEILELLDFAQVATPRGEELIRAVLERHGFGQEGHLGQAQAMLRALVAMPLAGFALAQVRPEERYNEMEFHLPLGRLRPEKLARFFQGEGGRDPFAQASLGLSFSPCHGFIHGFIDLVFVHGERYFLVDWKSNFLGEKPADYQQSALEEAMAEHNYFLQYHLYALALHRHLAVTLPDYEYERHFGGSYYLFLRGIDPEAPEAGNGVYFDRPSQRCLSELARVLAGDGEEKR
ncbi:MAG: exodeoxyribonuclease V subunit beta [Thermodesulfobacteriota bacterium]